LPPVWATTKSTPHCVLVAKSACAAYELFANQRDGVLKVAIKP
jgi:hypothetical protein